MAMQCNALYKKKKVAQFNHLSCCTLRRRMPKNKEVKYEVLSCGKAVKITNAGMVDSITISVWIRIEGMIEI